MAKPRICHQAHYVTKISMNTEELKDFIIKCLEDKKAENIIAIKLAEDVQLARYMIFASGRSTKNTKAIADYTALEIKRHTDHSVHIEGLQKSEWVLLDVGDIIVHVFYPETRKMLNLEQKFQNK